MISLLEKEARDPVEILRIKLKGLTDTSILNTQMLQEIKHSYLAKQNDTKGQLDSFVQAHIDEIERASDLLKVEEPIRGIASDFEQLSNQCEKMQNELAQGTISFESSVARRNLRELEAEILFYQELPQRLIELKQSLTSGKENDLVMAYKKWESFGDWAQGMLSELKKASIEKSDELGSSMAQNRLLASLSTRLNGIQEIHDIILSKVWEIIYHSIQLSQISPHRITLAFQVLQRMEIRRKRFVDSNHTLFDSNLQPMQDSDKTYSERCEGQIIKQYNERAMALFGSAEEEANKKQKCVFTECIEAANTLMMELELVQSDVSRLFPPDIDILQLYVTAYTTLMETEISKLCAHPDLGVTQRLQLIQYIDFFNAEIVKYKNSCASVVLQRTLEMLMMMYLDQIKSQLHVWIMNIWKRVEENRLGVNGEFISSRPSDIVNILKSQISIAQEWLSGHLLGQVVVACLNTLTEELQARYQIICSKSMDIEMEMICSFINDTNVLQAKCPELLGEITFTEKYSHEKTAFDACVGDKADVSSIEIVQFAMDACHLITDKLFSEVEQDTFRLWLTRKWDEQSSFVPALLETLRDYYSDLMSWINGSFFFSKIVRFCLDRSMSEYKNSILSRAHTIPSPEITAQRIESDRMCFLQFFESFFSELRRTGLRTMEALQKEFAVFDIAILTLSERDLSTLSWLSSEDINRHADVIAHLKQLVLDKLGAEGVIKTVKVKNLTSKDKLTAADKKAAKEREKRAKEREKAEKAAHNAEKAAIKAAKNKRSSVTVKKEPVQSVQMTVHSPSNEDFQVQSLEMSDFLQ